MNDREKVILGLQAIHDEAYDRWVHTQYTTDKLVTLVAKFVPNALVLLGEQEPVKPERECSGGGTTWWNVCGACRTAINPNDKYCHECGRAVKWDD